MDSRCRTPRRGLTRGSLSAAVSECQTIVFCGVHFMAETAKILSPDKTVLIPDLAAGCSLAETITAEQLVAWKAEHPGAVVVAYVNTSAVVKAESDVCCTSSNAVDVVRSIPEDREILFLPDFFLGSHVARETGRKIEILDGGVPRARGHRSDPVAGEGEGEPRGDPAHSP